MYSRKINSCLMKQRVILVTVALILITLLSFSNSTVDAEANWGNKHVLIIGIDGLRTDAFREAIKPNMDDLISNGVVTYDGYAGGDLANSTQQATLSGPGWSSILTGVWIDNHGVSDNSFSGHDFTNYPHFFSRLYEVNNDASLSSIVHWSPIDTEIIANSPYNSNFYRSTQSSDSNITIDAVNHINTSNPDVLFLHYDELDGVGHSSGFSVNNSAYMNKITEIDSEIGQVLNTIEARPNFANEDWLYIVVTDHGGRSVSHGGQSYEERRIPMIVSGGSTVNQEIFPGPGHQSVPSIVATHLGVGINPIWNWDNSTFGFNASNVTLESNLIGCYNFDNNTNDSSQENNNAISGGNPTFISGKTGNAISFDGIDDYISLGTSSDFNFDSDTDFTISCWVKNLNGGSDDDGVIIGNKDWDSGINSGWVIADGVTNPNSWQWNIGDDSDREDYEGDNGSVGDNDNIWHHIAVIHDRNDFAIMYLDGEIVGYENITDVENISSGLPLVIGADATLNDYFLNGQIDDVAIWNRRLSETEINSIINNANSGLSICQSTLGLSNLEFAILNLFPNPGQDTLHFSSELNITHLKTR